MYHDTLKIYLTTFIYLVFIVVSVGQTDYKIKWGQEQKVERKGILGNSNKSFFLGSDSDLIEIDESNKKVSQRKQFVLYKEKKHYVTDVFNTSKGTFGRLERTTRKRPFEYIVSPLNDSDNIDCKTIISESFNNKWDEDYRYKLFSKFTEHRVLSPDLSKVAIFAFIKKGIGRNSKIGMYIFVFDAELKLLWKKLVWSDAGKKMFANTLVGLVSNKGEVLIAHDTNKYGYSYKDCFIYHVTKTTENRTLLKLDESKLSNLSLFQFDQTPDKVYIFGYYKQKKKMHGMFIGSFPFGVDSIAPYKFLKHTITPENYDGYNFKNSIGFGYYRMTKDAVRFSNGNIAILSEINYRDDNYYLNSGGEKRSTMQYHSDDIAIPFFDSELNLLKIVKVKKQFNNSFETPISYGLGKMDNKMTLTFLQKKIPTNKKMKKWSKFEGKLIVINEKGNIIYDQKILDGEFYKYYPNESVQVGNQLFLMRQTEKGYSIGQVKLD